MMLKDVERLETDVFLIVSGRYLAEVLLRIETRLLQWSKQHICKQIAQKADIDPEKAAGGQQKIREKCSLQASKSSLWYMHMVHGTCTWYMDMGHAHGTCT